MKENRSEEDGLVRIFLALILLISTISVITANGFGNINTPAEEEKTLTQNNTPVIGDNITGQYKTATFALG